VPLDKQLKMMQVILYLNQKCKELVAQEKPISHIIETGLFEKVTRMKYDVPNDKPELFEGYYSAIDETLGAMA
jgi:V/A-type H+-transporting ATPase subunit A